MKNLLIIVIIICLLAISGSISYYYLVLLPQHDEIVRKAVAPTFDEKKEQVKQELKLFNEIMGDIL